MERGGLRRGVIVIQIKVREELRPNEKLGEGNGLGEKFQKFLIEVNGSDQIMGGVRKMLGLVLRAATYFAFTAG